MLIIQAPAKINLTLEVLGKRPDAYHEIRSVVQAVDLCDTLHFIEANDISFTCDFPAWSAEKSLVSQAAALLGGPKGASVRIEKRIPLLSGLGGDSSDAAAVLKGLNTLWRLNLPDEKLLSLAAQLGSDVPFFIRGGTALVSGRGETVTPLPAVPGMRLVILVPDLPVEPGKTGRMYAALNPSHFTDGSITQKLIQTIKQGKSFGSEFLFNAFENVAADVYPGLSYYISGCIRSGVPAHLAGSGPSLFSIFQDKTSAAEFRKKAEEHHARAYFAETL